MKKRNGGFTLIELLIALAVLSIMAGVLLQSFVISRRMNTKARKDELVLDAAKRTMEELKGYPFEKLETFLAGGGETPGEGDGSGSGDSGNVVIGNTIYRLERLEDGSGSDDGTRAGEEGGDENPPSSGSRQGYRLTAEYGRDTSGSGKVAYLICAEADYEKYNSTEDEDQEKSYSINRYQMPNIADVSSFQNVVIEPQALMKDDKSLTSQLLLKVNPDEEDGEGEDDSPDVLAADGSGSGDDENEILYADKDVKRYLWISVKETAAADMGEGTLTVQASTIYTVDPPGEGSYDVGDYDPDKSIEAVLASVKKNIVKDEKTRLPANRIYVFLPDDETKYIGTSKAKNDGDEIGGDEAAGGLTGREEIAGELTGGTGTEVTGFPGYKKIYISYTLEEKVKFFMVAANPDQYKENISGGVVTVKPEDGTVKSEADTELLLFSNLDGNEPVSFSEAENRLYHLTVTVYEALYNDTEESGGEPGKGREILKLDSTKSE